MDEQILSRLSQLDAASASPLEGEGFLSTLSSDTDTVLGEIESETASESPSSDMVKEIKNKEIEVQRREYLRRPEVQAEIIYQNYVNSRILSGQQKRNLRREILRDAKKGKYMKMFDEDYQRAKADAKFSKLNSPKKETV